MGCRGCGVSAAVTGCNIYPMMFLFKVAVGLFVLRVLTSPVRVRLMIPTYRTEDKP